MFNYLFEDSPEQDDADAGSEREAPMPAAAEPAGPIDDSEGEQPEVRRRRGRPKGMAMTDLHRQKIRSAAHAAHCRRRTAALDYAISVLRPTLEHHTAIVAFGGLRAKSRMSS